MVPEEVRKAAYKYTFDYENDPERTRAMLSAISQIKDTNQLLSLTTRANRFIGSFFTTLRPLFAPQAAVKDYGERLMNVLARESFIKGDNDIVSGTVVSRRMGSLLIDGDFMSSYYRGLRNQKDDSKFGQYWDEFKRSGAYLNFLDFLKELGRKTMTVLGPKDGNALRKAFRAVTTTKTFQAVEKKIHDWNNAFNALPIFLEYAALRESGVKPRSAAFYTQNSMDYFKRGELEPYASALYVFARPTIQGGANLLRSLNPFTKKTTEGQLKGAAVFVGLTCLALMVVSMLRGQGDDADDEKAGNVYDSLDLGTVTRAIVFPQKDGTIVKFPLPFGMPHYAWGVANVVDRFSRGLITGPEAAYYLTTHSLRQIMPDTVPAYLPSEDLMPWVFQTMTPTYLRPMADLAVNRNHWGGQINYGNRAVGVREFEKGRMATPAKWHSMARDLHDFTGLNVMTPESLRYLANGYLFGPLQAIAASAESSKLYEPRFASTREALGPFLTAIGASLYWGPEMDRRQVYYYRVKETMEKELTARGVRITDADNATHDDKIAFIKKNMKEGGFTKNQIEAELMIVEGDRALRKINEALREKYAHTRFGDIEERSLEKDFKAAYDEKDKIYKGIQKKLGLGWTFGSEGRGR
jgi:hypothetical protein